MTLRTVASWSLLGDSDDDMKPGAGHDGDEQQLEDMDMGAVGGDAPDGQPGEDQGDQPVGAALPPRSPLVASLGWRTIRVRLLLDDTPVPAPPGIEPPRVHLASPHCHTIPMVSGRCCSNVGERKPCPKCQSLLRPGEKGKCCRDGKEVLGPDLTPPIDAPYLAFLKELHLATTPALSILNWPWGPRAPSPLGTWGAWDSTTSLRPFSTCLASPTL